MSAVVIYMSLHGCTEKAAHILAGMHWEKVDLVNMKFQEPPSLEKYDTVIIGASVHMGTVQGKINKFCEEHEWELITKRLGLFLCHMHEGEVATRQFIEAFNKPLRDHAVAKGLFGGEFNLEKMNLQERRIMEKIAGTDQNVSNINMKAIEGFGKVIFHLDKS
jgi:menaquinone-dependent protoporphyrinogen oxidase